MAVEGHPNLFGDLTQLVQRQRGQRGEFVHSNEMGSLAVWTDRCPSAD